MPHLQILIASTRPGRAGERFGRWFAERARDHAGFDVEVIDLATVALPFFDEPRHPKLRQYAHQHTRDWSATISRGDAYVLVAPEYNHGYNAVLKNALDFLHHEWADKAVGLVSYGGVASGTRMVQALKPVLISLRMVPVVESVNIPFQEQFHTSDGGVAPNEIMQAAATAVLDELLRITRLLRPDSAPGGGR